LREKRAIKNLLFLIWMRL